MNRRLFLQQSTSLALLPFLANSSPSCKKHKFGIQLWSVKEDLATDLAGSIATLGKAGYHFVESFASPNGVFWGMKPQEFKKLLTDNGLTIHSSHCDPQLMTDVKKEDDFKKLAADAASIGMKYLINPYMGWACKSLDDFKRAADGMNRLGAIAAQNGMQYGYHNHHYSFQEMEGQIPQDVMMDMTDPKNVVFEMDLYWVVAAGKDPLAYFEKYPNRFKLSHVKDMHKAAVAEGILSKEKQTSPEWPVGLSCNLGTGKIDFKTILTKAEDKGMEYFIVEQERFDNGTRLESVAANAAFMKKIRF